MNYRPMFRFDKEPDAGNGLVFATKSEALGSAIQRFYSWMYPASYYAAHTDAHVTHTWSEAGGNQRLKDIGNE